MMRAEYYVRRRAKRARRMRTGPPPAPASGPEALRPEPCAEAVSARRPSASLSGVRPPRAIQALSARDAVRMVARTPRWPEGAARPQTSLCKMHPTRPAAAAQRGRASPGSWSSRTPCLLSRFRH
jgi:hypothetical protein